MSSTSKSMEDRIQEWLESQGYPLEMQVAREFARHGFRVLQSDYYEDLESGDSREIDVVAHMQTKIGKLLVRIEFVIECKSSRDKPWVLFTQHRPFADPARVAQRAASKHGKDLIRKLAHMKGVQDLELFSVPETNAYAITQAFTTATDVAYGAAMSVAKAAAGQIANADKYDSFGQPICLFVFPLIVIDGQLTEAQLQKDGTLVVNATNTGLLMWRNRVMHNLHNMISVIRHTEIDAYAAKMSISCSTLLEIITQSFPSLLEGKPK